MADSGKHRELDLKALQRERGKDREREQGKTEKPTRDVGIERKGKGRG